MSHTRGQPHPHSTTAAEQQTPRAVGAGLVRLLQRSGRGRRTRQDSSVPGTGHVEVFTAAAFVAQAVDGKDDNRPLEPFEAEDVAVEHVVAGEERIPVAVPAVVVEHLLLQLVPLPVTSSAICPGSQPSPRSRSTWESA